MTIDSSNIYLVAAEPGTGKTFTGDYLDHVHGFTHIDGDVAMRNLHISKNKELLAGWYEASYLREQQRDVPETLWKPYYQDIADRALEAAKTSDNVVITFAIFKQNERDFVLRKLKEGGANNPTLVILTMNKDVKMEGLYHRTKRQLEGSGLSLKDYFKSKGWEPDVDCDGDEDISLEVFKITFKKVMPIMFQPFDDPPSYAKVVDVTYRDVTAIDATDKAFGLDRNDELSYEEIVEKVLAIDRKRNEETPYGSETSTLMKEIKNKTENEREQIMKRRSSLMSVDRQLGLTRLSLSSNGDDGNSDGNEKLKTRRSSLIMTGKTE